MRGDTEPQVPTSLADKSNLSPWPLTLEVAMEPWSRDIDGACWDDSQRGWVNMVTVRVMKMPPLPLFSYTKSYLSMSCSPECTSCSSSAIFSLTLSYFLLCFCSVILIPVSVKLIPSLSSHLKCKEDEQFTQRQNETATHSLFPCLFLLSAVDFRLYEHLLCCIIGVVYSKQCRTVFSLKN